MFLGTNTANGPIVGSATHGLRIATPTPKTPCSVPQLATSMQRAGQSNTTMLGFKDAWTPNMQGAEAQNVHHRRNRAGAMHELLFYHAALLQRRCLAAFSLLSHC